MFQDRRKKSELTESFSRCGAMKATIIRKQKAEKTPKRANVVCLAIRIKQSGRQFDFYEIKSLNIASSADLLGLLALMTHGCLTRSCRTPSKRSTCSCLERACPPSRRRASRRALSCDRCDYIGNRRVPIVRQLPAPHARSIRGVLRLPPAPLPLSLLSPRRSYTGFRPHRGQALRPFFASSPGSLILPLFRAPICKTNAHPLF